MTQHVFLQAEASIQMAGANRAETRAGLHQASRAEEVILQGGANRGHEAGPPEDKIEEGIPAANEDEPKVRCPWHAGSKVMKMVLSGSFLICLLQLHGPTTNRSILSRAHKLAVGEQMPDMNLKGSAHPRSRSRCGTLSYRLFF